MPRKLQLDEILNALKSGNLGSLIGGLECEYLECKSAPYRLSEDAEKMEFAKDISALANADGGVILLGASTEQDLTFRGEAIRSFGCFDQTFVDMTQCQNVASEWVVPPIRGLKFEWHPDANDSAKGIVSILVPLSAAENRPYLVNRVVLDTGNVAGAYIGYFERTRDNVTPMRAAEMREKLKDGLRFSELNPRIANIEVMIGDLSRSQIAPEPVLNFDSEIFPRVRAARHAFNSETVPTFSLAAWPLQPLEFPGLFQSNSHALVQLLERPPELRSSGFNIRANRSSTIIEGRLRRCVAPKFRLLEIWRDGPVICVVEGGEGHLCWGTERTGFPDLQINNIALAETTYLFCDWALKIYQHAEPKPARVKFRLMFADMQRNGNSFDLNSQPLTGLDFGFQGRPAPMAEGQHFEIETEATASPGVVAYQLLAEVYVWFGFNSDDMPYADRTGAPFSINVAKLMATS